VEELVKNLFKTVLPTLKNNERSGLDNIRILIKNYIILWIEQNVMMNNAL
jgi:hypothetical protein